MDDDTQDMSGGIAPEGTPPSPNLSQASGSSSATTEHTSLESGHLPGSSTGNKSKKQKLGKGEDTNELLDKVITAKENSDKLLLNLEEKRMKIKNL